MGVRPKSRHPHGSAALRTVGLGALAAALAACSSVARPPSQTAGAHTADSASHPPRPIAALLPGETGWVVQCGKVITFDSQERVLSPGTVVVRNGKIEAVGRDFVVPPGFSTLHLAEGWLSPGFVDLHTHIQSDGFRDTNDSVYPINVELRTSPAIRTGNPNIARALAGGVTTLFGIPGSGSSISGFGVLYKTKGAHASYADCVLADPGGMKVAQAYNPERGAGDFGATRAGLGWILEDVNEQARAATAQGRKDPRLANLMKVHTKELPVLIHTAGSDGVGNVVRMWTEQYPVRSILSHGCFDGWKVAEYAGKSGIAMNNGPRIIDYLSSREGSFVGYTSKYVEHGSPLVSLNTDSPVVPQEELSLQGGMAARYGSDAYLMLKAITIAPARSIGIDHRVGSLEHGKDADLVVFNGNPLDPRSRVEWVMIDGHIEYDRKKDGQRF